MEALGRRVKESSVVLPTPMPATDTPKLKAAAWKHIGWSLIHVPGEKKKLLAEAGNVCLRKGLWDHQVWMVGEWHLLSTRGFRVRGALSSHFQEESEFTIFKKFGTS